jgi:hypothetical protein
MNGDDIIKFQEEHYDTLIEKFIELHEDEWEAFVEQQAVEWEAASEDREDDERTHEL